MIYKQLIGEDEASVNKEINKPPGRKEERKNEGVKDRQMRDLDRFKQTKYNKRRGG